MGFFWDLFLGQAPKPRVTELEWKKVRGNLISLHHFTEREVNEIEEVFRGDLYEEKDRDKGKIS